MPKLLLSPVGAGKTEAVLNALTEAKNDKPLAPVWVLLATERQIHTFKRRMLDETRHSRIFFNIEYFNFYTLYSRLLELAHQPQKCLDENARYRLLRQIIQQEAGSLKVFGRIADRPGLAKVLADFIYELKAARVWPDEFKKAAQTDRDHDLAHLYGVYQDVLRKHRLVDLEGQGWLAVEAVDNDLTLANKVRLLIVDGYDQFSPLQADLLAALAGRVGETLITLTHVADREHTVGKRFMRARRQLHEAFEHLSLPLDEAISSAGEAARPAALTALQARLFRHDAAPLDIDPVEPPLQFIEAPDPEREAAAILRRVKHLLLREKVVPDQVLIALRDWPTYAPFLRTYAREFKLDTVLAFHSSESLSENPAIVALTDLLQLSVEGFPRITLLDTLSSPYFDMNGLCGLTPELAALLAKVAEEQVVTTDPARWLGVLDRLAQPRDESALDTEEDRGRPTYDPVQINALRTALADFFTLVTPPPEASYSTYITWLEALIGPDPALSRLTSEGAPDDLIEDPEPVPAGPVHHLNMIGRVRERARPNIIARDLHALKCFKNVLRQMIAAETLVNTLTEADEQTMAWPLFVVDLMRLVKQTPVERAPMREGKVLITTVANARGLPHDYVFILGLAEGVFPARQPEDPLYLDAERRTLTQQGIPLLTRAEMADDEGLFYELLGLARKRVIFSRFTTRKGELWPESALWRAAHSLAPDDALLEKQPLGKAVDAARAASINELSVALAAAASSGGLVDVSALGWLNRKHNSYWTHVVNARQVEANRLNWRAPYDIYTGRLTAPDLRAYVHDLIDRRVWSASQLTELGTCGYRFFAHRLLKLEELKAPEEGIDALILGSIQHKIMEETFNGRGRDAGPLRADEADELRARLEEAAEKVLADAPQVYGFLPSPTWAQEKQRMVQRLNEFLTWELEEGGKFDGQPISRTPWAFERRFGPVGFKVSFDGLELRMTGSIDRIDRIEAGGQTFWMATDYKSGTSRIPPKKLEQGVNFQMLTYLKALETLQFTDPELAEGEVGIGRFVSLNGDSGGLGNYAYGEGLNLLKENNHVAMDAALQQGVELLKEQVESASRGDFATDARRPVAGACDSYCDFIKLCRHPQMARNKGNAHS